MKKWMKYVSYAKVVAPKEPSQLEIQTASSTDGIDAPADTKPK